MIVWVVCVCGSALLFDAIGVYAVYRKEPMWFWAGTMVDKAAITDAAAYNRANGRMWIAYSLPYWIAGVLGVYSPVAGCIALFAGAIGGSFGLVAAYQRIYRKYTARQPSPSPSGHLSLKGEASTGKTSKAKGLALSAGLIRKAPPSGGAGTATAVTERAKRAKSAITRPHLRPCQLTIQKPRHDSDGLNHGGALS